MAGSFRMSTKSLEQTIQERYKAADDYVSQKRDIWAELENIFLGVVKDELSSKSSSKVFDHRVSTFILESEARVMASLGSGKAKPIDRDDELTSLLMNMKLEKYIQPNATSQFPLLLKHRIMHRNSKIYGTSFALCDWVVKRNGYTGPDLWLLPIRDVFPQVGAISLSDSDYIIIRTWQPASFFKSLDKKDGWINLPEVMAYIQDKSGNKHQRDDDAKSERERGKDDTPSKADGYFEVLTMYERDRWVDYIPSATSGKKTTGGIVFRDRKNPNKDGELPVVCKYGIPMDTDFFGLSDTERGKTLQLTINSAWNMALDSAKFSLFPPALFNADTIIKSTIRKVPGANWLARGNLDNAYKSVSINPQGAQTHQYLYNTANAALMNLFSTSDTSVSKEIDSTLGKTPQALKMQEIRGNSKDAFDRFYVDLYLQDVYRKFINMEAKRQSGKVNISMIKGEAEKMVFKYPEMAEMYDAETGNISIPKNKTGSITWDFEIVPGSSYATDKKTQQDNLLFLFELLMKYGQTLLPIIEQKEGTEIRFTKLLQSIAGDNVDKIDEFIVPAEKNVERDMAQAQQNEADFAAQSQELMDFVESLEVGNTPQNYGTEPIGNQAVTGNGAPMA